ncbi:MAG: carboxypeptidase regulatory-like domain-containing protein [Acidobacteria bacterium]|nr:carboxypeptidase regulatory-like domain-containing protein [Acidobacteriota bacterium]
MTDQTDAVLQAARIEIKSLESPWTESTLTDHDGRYVFDAVPPGRYEVSAAFAGFETSVPARTIVTAHQVTVVDFSLHLGKSESVVVVTAAPSSEGIPDKLGTYDTAALLDGVPGLSVYNSGGVSSLPAIHGMADDRVNVVVDGMSISSACSNHMNPPLSYIAPANVGRVTVIAGITPVSRGGDSVGGSIVVDAAVPEFAAPGDRLLTHGSVSVSRRSSAMTTGGNASASLATENFRIAYNGSYVDADNYTSGDGVRVGSTFYEATNHAVQIAGRRGRGLTKIDLGLQSIPQQGFVNARMDMTGNRATSANLSHDAEFGWGRLLGRAYYVSTRHEMNILRDKIPGMSMPMNSNGTNAGFSIKADLALPPRDGLRIGHEFHRFRLDDWWPPVSATLGSMGPDTLWNVRDGRRDRFGTYAEWETTRGEAWTVLLGVRSDVVRMNAGSVAGYNMSATTAGSAAYYADATAFNSRDRKRLDNNVDLTVLTKYETGSAGSYALGYARKTRSPNLYERYLWVKRSNMSVRMNGWFGDANGYTGNLDLQPEVANTFSATAGWRSRAAEGWELTITPYYTSVGDFIDVDRCAVVAGSNSCTAANLTATAGFVNLQFANHRARLYGVDGSGRLPLGSTAKGGAFDLTGVLGYVRGTNLQTGDNLYHMMPLKTKMTLEHHRGAWTGALELQTVAAKRYAQAVRNELQTAGYALVNLRGSYRWQFLQIDAGIENVSDRNYDLPLGGRYWVGDRTGSSSVPGQGRSIFGGLTLKF